MIIIDHSLHVFAPIVYHEDAGVTINRVEGAIWPKLDL